MGNSIAFGTMILIAFLIRAAANGHLGQYLSVFTGGLSTNQATLVNTAGSGGNPFGTGSSLSNGLFNNVNTTSAASNPIASINLTGTQNTGLPF